MCVRKARRQWGRGWGSHECVFMRGFDVRGAWLKCVWGGETNACTDRARVLIALTFVLFLPLVPRTAVMFFSFGGGGRVRVGQTYVAMCEARG